MPLVSTILIWREGTTLYSRITTNVSRPRLLARLAALGLLESLDEIHAYFGDRADGGNGYELKWKDHVRWDDLPHLLGKL